ncbi:MAG: hypothetical protein R6X33_07495 [Candidatus Brocadiia bacterium]
MRDDTRKSDPMDGLVRRYLRSEEERVDGEAFLRRLKERREREEKVVRFPVRALLAAAALLLVAAGGLIALLRSPGTPPPPGANGDLLALERCGEAVRTELRAAFEGARGVGAAALSAGREPLEELARARVPLPRWPRSAESALRRFVPLEERHLPQEENEQ